MNKTIKDHFDVDDHQVINLAMGLKYPIDIEALKLAFCNSVLIKNPKFCSVITTDKKGKKNWQKTHVNINDHLIIHHHLSPTTTTVDTSLEDYKEATINAFLTNAAGSSKLTFDQNKPLWKLHVLMDLNCVVLRVHHALGDEFSLMSMLSACFGRNSENIKQKGYMDDYQSMKSNIHMKKNRGFWEVFQSLWLTLIYLLRFVGRILWIKDEFSEVDESNKCVVWPSKLVSAEYMLEDFWYVKTAIPCTTINDVLLGVISCGLSKYIDLESTRAKLKEQQHSLTAIFKVNLHKDPTVLQKFEDMMKTSSGSSTWGDKTSLVLLPIYCRKRLHPLEHVTVMKAIMNKKKMSYEANCIHFAKKCIASCLGPKVGSWFYDRALSNSTLMISTIKGPAEEIVIGNNPVTYIRGHISSKSHAGITISMVSYAGRVDVQVMVAKEVISNPHLLIKCFHESLLEMKSYSKLIHLLLSTGNTTYNTSVDWFLYV
ncbi:hypothetical protein RND81_14G236100 [Saponaria officinalis]|uniref:O-acyltransferase WSD1 C-terminal domain-containing protein n=1 Tax=Saponaria officinalis TaxID=3572 RepID=A0AAW1GQK8_SAPOF